jgi:drug/metabolite transporter (DMT)-like permease
MVSPRRASNLNVWLALGTVYLVWGSTYLAIAIAVKTLPPLFYSGVRFASAGLILTAWLAFRGVDLRVSRRELAGAAIVGTLLLALANGLVNVAERTVPSGVAALIVASIPLWIVVYRVVAGERIGRDLLAGVFLGLVGVAILVVPGGLNGTIDLLGAFLLFIATLSWALGTFLSPRLATPRNAFVSTAYQMLAGGVVLIVVAVVLGALVLGEAITTNILIGAAVIVVAVAFIVFRQNAARRAERLAPTAEAAD